MPAHVYAAPGFFTRRVFDPIVAFLGNYLARAAHFLRDVFHLRQPVLDAQLRLLIVDVDAGLICKVRNDRCIHVGESHAGMLGEDVAATRFAPFAIAVRRLVVSADVVCSPRDPHRFGFP